MTPLSSLAPGDLKGFCTKHRVRSLSLFGSRLHGSHRVDSDVDLLVEFEADARPSLLDLAAMELELSAMLGGLRVDIRTAQELSRYFRDDVLREAEVQFVAA
jgi:hypothetical protein